MVSATPQKAPLRFFQSSGGRAHLTTNSRELAPTRISAQMPKGIEVMRKKHIGSSFDDFLGEKEAFEEAQALAAARCRSKGYDAMALEVGPDWQHLLEA